MSADPEAMNLPSGDIETEVTLSECPVSVAIHFLEAISHILTLLSSDPEAMKLPSGDIVTEVTNLLCPFSVAVHFFVATSHIRTV